MDSTLQTGEIDSINKIGHFPSSTIHELIGKIGNLPSSIKPIAKEMKICGFATTVLSPPSDNLWIHRAIYQTKPGNVLVVDVGTAYENGYWGEIMTHAAIQQGITGLVINGCVRDYDSVINLNFPIFSRGICLKGTEKNKTLQGAINSPCRIGDTIIFPGDLILGDTDGVVVVPRSMIAQTTKLAKQRQDKEEQAISEIRQGKSTLELYDLY